MNLDNYIIEGTVTSNHGYAHIKYGCELKDTKEVRDLFEKNPIAIAEHLDGGFNFGGRGFYLTKLSNGNLRYEGTIHTD